MDVQIQHRNKFFFFFVFYLICILIRVFNEYIKFVLIKVINDTNMEWITTIFYERT